MSDGNCSREREGCDKLVLGEEGNPCVGADAVQQGFGRAPGRRAGGRARVGVREQ